MDALVSAVDFADVITAILAVGAAVILVVVTFKGAGWVINALKRV